MYRVAGVIPGVVIDREVIGNARLVRESHELAEFSPGEPFEVAADVDGHEPVLSVGGVVPSGGTRAQCPRHTAVEDARRSYGMTAGGSHTRQVHCGIRRAPARR